MMRRRMAKFPSLLLLLLWSSLCCGPTTLVQAQRFLRDGFTSKLDEEFKYEAGLDNTNNSPVGMPREMCVLADLDWQLLPPKDFTIPNNPALTKHLRKYLNQPLQLQLEQRKGGIGYRAFGIPAAANTIIKNGQQRRLRGSWRRAESPQKLLNSDFLKVSYDEAVRSRLFFLEIEMVLPRLPKRLAAAAAAATTAASTDPKTTTPSAAVTTNTANTTTKRKPPIPRVIYQFAVEGGVMNPKAMIPRGDCAVKVLYSSDTTSTTGIPPVGPPLTAKIALRMKTGLVDPGWARGRTILRQGRSAGVI
ncbi:hypothetical protein ACA910_016383 [Epithemia clementina (nom. ined.)]